MFPPVRRALNASITKRIAVFGVASLISSPEIRAYVAREAAGIGKVDLVNASDLVELVESGAFLSDVDGTLAAVRAKLERSTRIQALPRCRPLIYLGLPATWNRLGRVCVFSIRPTTWSRRSRHTSSLVRVPSGRWYRRGRATISRISDAW